MATGNPILDAAYSGAASTSAVVSQSSAGIINDRTAQQTLADSSASIDLDIGTNNAIIDSVKNQAALSAQNARLKAGAIFGADLNQQGEQISAAADTMNQAYAQKQQALQNIQQKDSVGFMDNPLGFILNQFSVNDDIRAHNSALEIEQAAKGHIEDLNALSNATAQNQKNFEINVTQASIDAATKNTLNTAQLSANKAETEGLGYNVDALQTAMNASKEQTALKFQVLGAQNSQAQLKLAMDNYALHKQEFQWQQDQHEANQATDEYLTDRIQKGLTVMYGANAPDLTASPKLAKTYLTLLKSNTPAGKEATDAYMAGQTGVLGGNPAQVIDSINSGVAVQFTPAQAPIKNLLDVAKQKVDAGVQTGQVTKANYSASINSTVTGQINDYLKDIEPGSANNPFNIGAVSSLISMPGVSSTPLAQKVLAPAAAAGAKFDDPKQVYSTAVDAVNKGTISLNDAVDGITALYQKGVDTNLQVRQITKFGIVPTENMHSYNTRVEVDPTALFGGTSIVNLTDRNAVLRAVNKTMARQAMGSFEDTINPFAQGMKAAQTNDAGTSMMSNPRPTSPHTLSGYNQ